MKTTFRLAVLCLLLTSLSTFTFAIPDKLYYEACEVDSPAQPAGGMGQWIQFVHSNLQIPHSISSYPFSGQVIVSMIIGADGNSSTPEIIKSLGQENDQEALRVINLFKAWKPALYNHKPVPQKIILPIDFVSAEEISVENGILIEYYDDYFKKVDTKKESSMFCKVPMDNGGFPKGNKVFYKTLNPNSPYFELKFEQSTFNRASVYGGIYSDTLRQCQQIYFRNKNGKIEGNLYRFYPNGEIFEMEQYRNGKIYGVAKKYYPNGLLGEEKIFTNNTAADFEYFRWHPNGQIAEISSYSLDGDDNFKMSYTVYSFWDAQGKVLVNEGDGEIVLEKYSPSNKSLVEIGKIQNGVKNGLWEGFTDSKLKYQETYSAGMIAMAGYIDEAGRLRYYNKINTQPEYKKGEAGLSQFLTDRLTPSAGLGGKIQVDVMVEKSGKLGELDLSGNLDATTKKQITDILKKTEGSWKPATYRGEPISAKYSFYLNLSYK